MEVWRPLYSQSKSLWGRRKTQKRDRKLTVDMSILVSTSVSWSCPGEQEMCACACNMSLHRKVHLCKGTGGGFPLGCPLVKTILESQGSY